MIDMNDNYLIVHKALEESHWWFVARRQILRTVVSRLMRDCNEDFVVDVGCGTGGMVAFLSREYRCLGVDQSELGIGAARERFPDCQFICGPVPDSVRELSDKVALYLLMDVLEHIKDDRQFLKDLIDIARPGAKILITVPARKALWSPHDVAAHHFRRYELEELRQLWAGLNVNPCFLTFFNSRLYPLIWLARRASNALDRSWGREGTDFSLPPAPLNWLLARIFSGEATRIGTLVENPGTRGFGYGASLLAVLQKKG